jgi:hypothetical protein
MEEEYDEKKFEDIICNINYPKCPKCNSKNVVTAQFISCCLSSSCNWIGSSSSIIKQNILLKSLYASESYFNLLDYGDNSLKHFAKKISEQKGLPGFGMDKVMFSAKFFTQRKNDFGEEVEVNDFIKNNYIKLLKLFYCSTLNRVSHLAVKSKVDRSTIIKSSILLQVPEADNKMGHLDTGSETPNSYYFNKKNVVDVQVSKNEDENIIKSYISVYGYPDLTFTGKYNQYGGASTEDDSIDIKFSSRQMTWQPFYWPCIDLSKDLLIHLAGVLQTQSENITYIVTECMDTGSFHAGIYKRTNYSPEPPIFIKSKAETCDDAIKRLRTSFEKTVLSYEQDNEILDFSWIHDFGYDSSFSESFMQIASADFWLQAINCELINVIGSSKKEILEDLSNQIENEN